MPSESARAAVAALFAGRDELPAVLGAGLEGFGVIVADPPEQPQVARVSVGCYDIFGGDPAASGAARLVQSARRPVELVYGGDPAWRRLIRQVQGAAVTDRPMRSFDPSGLRADELEASSQRLPPGFEMARMDVALAGQLDAGLEPHALQVYASPAAFASWGLGFAAVAQGRVACAATSYALSSGHLELAIATREKFRGHGLASARAPAIARAHAAPGPGHGARRGGPVVGNPRRRARGAIGLLDLRGQPGPAARPAGLAGVRGLEDRVPLVEPGRPRDGRVPWGHGHRAFFRRLPGAGAHQPVGGVHDRPWRRSRGTLGPRRLAGREAQ